MEISRNLAYQIVNNLKDIVNQDLNFMDRQGIIIASTDPNRINTFHQAAKVCVDKNEVVIIEFDNQYKGSKKGVNVPVEFDNETIGVIGITGDRIEVEKYGTIIKKMTEILLKEEWIKENQIQRRDNYRNFIEGIIYNRFDETELLISRENNLSKYIAVSKVLDSYSDASKTDEIMNILDSFFFNDNNVTYAFLFQELVILFLNKNRNFISKTLEEINATIENTFNYEITFGVSNEFFLISEGNEYFKQGRSAYSWHDETTRFPGNVLFYDDLDLGILLTNVSKENKFKFSEKVLGNLNDKELDFYSNLVDLYGKENGSIKKISEILFMHKNTVQYRLNKLYELTGYNPREYNGYLILKLAFLTYNTE